MVFAVVILIFVGFAVALMWRPATIIALGFSIYAFEQWAQANSAFFGANASFINFGFGILTLWALANIVTRGTNPLNPTTNAFWLWLALFCYAGISCLWSLDRDLSMFLFKYHFPYMVTFAGLLPLVITRSDDVYKSFLATLIFGTGVMLLLLINTKVHAWGRTIETTGIVDRVGQTRTRLSPLAIAEFAGNMLIIAVLMNFRGIHRFWQYGRWGVAFISLGLIYRSGSRGQLIGALIAVVLFIVFSRGTKRAVGWVATAVSSCLIIGFAALSFIGFADQNRSRWQVERMQEQFGDTRFHYAGQLLEYWMTSGPIAWMFGLGSSASYDTRLIGVYCHVLVVEILGELGLVGLTIALALMACIARDVYQLYQITKEDDVARGVTITLAAIFTYQVILSFKQGSFLTHNFTFCCGLFIARHAAVTRIAYQKERALEMQKRWYYYYYSQMAQQGGGSVGGQPAG